MLKAGNSFSQLGEAAYKQKSNLLCVVVIWLQDSSFLPSLPAVSFGYSVFTSQFTKESICLWKYFSANSYERVIYFKCVVLLDASFVGCEWVWFTSSRIFPEEADWRSHEDFMGKMGFPCMSCVSYVLLLNAQTSSFLLLGFRENWCQAAQDRYRRKAVF